MIIRPAQEKDVPQLLNLLYEYIVDFYHKPRPSEQALASLIHSLLGNSEKGIQFVAENDGQMIGFATLYFAFSTLQVKRSAILNDLYVTPSGRGLKVGETLFKACHSYIRDNGFAYMTWETAKDNHVAQKLYDKLGGHRSEWLVYEIS